MVMLEGENQDLSQETAVLSPEISQAPAVIQPAEFNLASFSETLKKKIIDEVFDKQRMHQSAFSNFNKEYYEASNNYLMIPAARKPFGFPNSKTGESTRAVNTLASLEFRMLTAADPYLEAYGMGLKEDGTEMTEDELYAAVQVQMEQASTLKFKKKFLRSLRSGKLFGTFTSECPFVSFPYGDFQKYFEGTDWVHRPLIQVFFDPYIYDIEFSDYFGVVDYVTKYKILQLSYNDGGTWDKKAILDNFEKNKNSNNKFETEVWNEIRKRKQIAGYNDEGDGLNEIITYDGVLDTDNDLIKRYYEFFGLQGDIRLLHWRVRIQNGTDLINFDLTPFGNWHHVYKTGSYNEFEFMPIGNGIDRVGRRLQVMLDALQSRGDLLMKFAQTPMFKVGRYSGYKSKNFEITPLKAIVLDDINQLEAFKPFFEAIQFGLALTQDTRESFRNVTGAKSNLQAELTKASATEVGIAQNEAIREASVLAELIADILRDYFKTSHVNNTYLLDNDIYVSWTGMPKEIPRNYNKYNLPRNIGFEIKTTTDKNFRPERMNNLIQFLGFAFSAMTKGININVEPFLFELGRMFELNPRKLRAQPNIATDVSQVFKQAVQKSPELLRQDNAEIAGDSMGGGRNVQKTPIGNVSVSPNSSLLEMSA